MHQLPSKLPFNFVNAFIWEPSNLQLYSINVVTLASLTCSCFYVFLTFHGELFPHFQLFPLTLKIYIRCFYLKSQKCALQVRGTYEHGWSNHGTILICMFQCARTLFFLESFKVTRSFLLLMGYACLSQVLLFKFFSACDGSAVIASSERFT